MNWYDVSKESQFININRKADMEYPDKIIRNDGKVVAETSNDKKKRLLCKNKSIIGKKEIDEDVKIHNH